LLVARRDRQAFLLQAVRSNAATGKKIKPGGEGYFRAALEF
jgi:hypothetical protein